MKIEVTTTKDRFGIVKLSLENGSIKLEQGTDVITMEWWNLKDAMRHLDLY